MRITGLRNWLACLLLGNGGAALAAWSSGGGIIRKDDTNPWFIENTKEVTYCIIRDEEHFKIDENEGVPLNTLVRKALDYWRDDFAYMRDSDEFWPWNPKVATQRFVEQHICDNADIQFQFGYLSRAQINEMEKRSIDPKDYFSLAVRTDYDEVNLKGKGFIYLAADSGALRPNSNKMADPWAKHKGALTYRVLVHELGHVFGIQHQGSSFRRKSGEWQEELMAADYPQNVLEKAKGPVSKEVGFSIPSFLRYKQPETAWTRGANCNSWDKYGDTFYGLNGDDRTCFSEEFRNDRLQVFTFTTPGVKTLAGFAELRPNEVVSEVVVSVWLPENQKVYPIQDESERFLQAGFRYHEYYKGVYKSLSGSVEREVSVLRSPSARWNRVGGVLDGKELIYVKYGL